MQTINWGIIGCGDVTEKKSGPAFNKVENSRLVAVMRRNPEKAADYAKRHGVPKWYSDAYQLISDPEINAIYIATPPDSHEEYTLAALKAGKPVYVEKPFSLSANSAKKIVEAVEKHQTKLVVAHYRRGLPMFMKIKDLIQSETIGKTRLINLNFLQPHMSAIITQTDDNWRVNPAKSGGGLFHDMAPHQLDILMWIFGEPTQTRGIALNQGGFYPADDLVSGNVIFKNGVVLSGSWSFAVAASEAKDWCEIIGTEGKIGFPIFGNYYELTIGNKTERVAFETPENIQRPMIDKVVKYFLNQEENPCSAKDGLTVMTMIDNFINHI